MQPWLVDAKDVEFDDLGLLDQTILRRTEMITAFLSDTNRAETIVVGPKGIGKTLLVKAKRFLLLRKSGVKAIPRNSLVDKPSIPAPSLSKKAISNIGDSEFFWHIMWGLSFSIAILNEQFLEKQNEIKWKKEDFECKEILDHLLQRTSDKEFFISKQPSDIFKSLVEISKKDFQRALRDHNILTPHLRTIHSPTYLFLDNIDELFDAHLVSNFKNSTTRLYGELKPDYWYAAQCGALLAAREIASLNQHVRVYLSIRREALDWAVDRSMTGAQLRGACVEISYDNNDLQSILVKNIDLETRSGASETLQLALSKWVQDDAKTLEHVTTGEDECLFDYIARHTMGRPRDIVQIGKQISAISFQERKRENIRRAVNSTAAKIARDYLRECEPHMPLLDKDSLIPLIRANVLTFEEMGLITKTYSNILNTKEPGFLTNNYNPFFDLYRIGLLGYVGRHAMDGDETQLFQVPGKLRFPTLGELPKSEFYLVHPILSDLISSIQGSSSDYLKNANRLNIVAPGRPWRRPQDGSFVVEGDVVGFSDIMNSNDEGYRRFLQKFSSAVKRVSRFCQYAKVERGDSFIIIDPSSVNVVKAVREIYREMKSSNPPVTLRVGADYGYVRLLEELGTRMPLGSALRVAARIEAIGAPNTLTASAYFVKWATQSDQLSKQAALLGQKNIAKDGEPPEHRDLYQINLQALDQL